jgi:serine/threonine-protein kinase
MNQPAHVPAASQPDGHERRAQARVGAVLRGKWRIDRLLGVGGMAAVYAGTHRNGQRGAIKMLHPELSADEAVRARFLREGYVANRVGHPGAVSVLDDDMAEDGSVFLVMELLQGQCVAAIAEKRPGQQLGLREALGIADQLLDVLRAAHAQGIVHRDIKPDNLFLTQTGVLKVLDFGIARMREDAGAAAKLTQTGAAMGTPAFMPPEQALGEWHRVDGRADLWAAGASIYTLLTGRFVHEAETLNKLLLKAMTANPAPLAKVAPEVRAEVADVIDRALAFAVEKRWPDAATMQQAVRRALTVADDRPLRVTAGAPAVAAMSMPDSMVASAAPTVRRPESRGRGPVALLAGLGIGFVLVGGAVTAALALRPKAPIAAPTALPVVAGGAPSGAPAPTVSAAGEPSAVAPAPSASATAAAPSASASAKPRTAPSAAGPRTPPSRVDPSLRDFK